MILKQLLFLSVVALFAPVVARCEVTGGGWILGANGGKATFDVEVNDDGSGTFSYFDKGFRSSDFPNGVNIVGMIESLQFTGTGVVQTAGTYIAKQRGTSGYFTAAFRDTGQKGPQKGDSLEISLYPDSSSTVQLYDNARVLGDGKNGGGNITVAGASTGALVVFGSLLAGWIFCQRRGALFGARH